jgi:PAS domain S-box-containing protein
MNNTDDPAGAAAETGTEAEALRRQNALFASLLKLLPMGVFMVEAPSGKPLLANEAALTLLGRGILPDASRENLSEVYKAHKPGSREPYPLEEMPILRGMRGESSHVDDMMVERPDGTSSRLEVFGSPVADEQGRIWASLVSFMDITERKRAEEALARLNSQLHAKNKELEQVVYVASHDLRSPLVNIDGYGRELSYAVEALNRTFETAPASVEALKAAAQAPLRDMADALRYIRGSASQMDALLTGLLKLSRFGRTSLTILPLDMDELVARVLSASEFQLRKSGVDLAVAPLPPCLGDAVQVSQIFTNLLSNALKFLDPARPGVIRISGQVKDQSVVYCVEDNGIGIAPAHRENIFEIFHRLEPSKSQGEGLGLSIVRQAVGRLGGDVWVDSTPGVGSRFHVALPAARA